jgi:hypothetical protein
MNRPAILTFLILSIACNGILTINGVVWVVGQLFYGDEINGLIIILDTDRYGKKF